MALLARLQRSAHMSVTFSTLGLVHSIWRSWVSFLLFTSCLTHCGLLTKSHRFSKLRSAFTMAHLITRSDCGISGADKQLIIIVRPPHYPSCDFLLHTSHPQLGSPFSLTDPTLHTSTRHGSHSQYMMMAHGIGIGTQRTVSFTASHERWVG